MKLFIVFLLAISVSHLKAQTTKDTTEAPHHVVVYMRNGDEFKGIIISQDSRIVVLQTENGILNLNAQNVNTIETDFTNGKFSFSNPNANGYFFSSTAIPLKKNTGYYQNLLLFGNLVNYGVTDNISIGGGLEFLSSLLGHPIWFFTPKVGFEVGKNLHAGAGLFMVGFEGQTVSLGYGVGTWGNKESNMTLGIGYGFAGSQMSHTPAIMIGGLHRVSKGIALLSDNYIIPTDGSTLMFGIEGIRILSRKNSFDVGVLLFPSDGLTYGIPFVGFQKAF